MSCSPVLPLTRRYAWLVMPLLFGAGSALTASPEAPAETRAGQATLPAATEHAVTTAVEAVAGKVAAEAATAGERLPTEWLKNRSLVLRVSKEFIRQHTPAVVDKHTPVDRWLFGAHITGTAITNGRPVMAKQPDDTKPMIVLHFQGTTTTKTVANKGSLKIWNKGRATFDVRREISFDGLDFQKGHRTIDCSYQSTLTGIGGPPGLRGWVTRTLARPLIERQRPTADSVARADLQKTILEAFGKQTDKLVADLNANLPWKETVALLTQAGPGRQRQFSAMPKWIEARSVHIDQQGGQLPEESNVLHAPIELWVQGEPRSSVTGQLLSLWNATHRSFDRFRETVLPTSAAKESGIQPEMVGDWWVIRIGSDVADRFLKKNSSAVQAEAASS